MITELLARGAATGVFRRRVDPIQLYISIAALGYFYFANVYTLSGIFGVDLQAKEARETRRRHVVDVILSYLTSKAQLKTVG